MTLKQLNLVSVSIVFVEHCKYTCPGGWVVPAYLGGATAYLADSENKASLTSSETVLGLPTGTELDNKKFDCTY